MTSGHRCLRGRRGLAVAAGARISSYRQHQRLAPHRGTKCVLKNSHENMLSCIARHPTDSISAYRSFAPLSGLRCLCFSFRPQTAAAAPPAPTPCSSCSEIVGSHCLSERLIRALFGLACAANRKQQEGQQSTNTTSCCCTGHHGAPTGVRLPPCGRCKCVLGLDFENFTFRFPHRSARRTSWSALTALRATARRPTPWRTSCVGRCRRSRNPRT